MYLRIYRRGRCTQPRVTRARAEPRVHARSPRLPRTRRACRVRVWEKGRHCDESRVALMWLFPDVQVQTTGVSRKHPLSWAPLPTTWNTVVSPRLYRGHGCTLAGRTCTRGQLCVVPLRIFPSPCLRSSGS